MKRRKRLGIVMLLLIVMAAVLIPLISPYSYSEMSVMLKNNAPSLQHPFGTDRLGRDILVRVCFGVRISLCIGFGSALINGTIGLLYGGTAGLGGAGLDMVMMRMADILAAIPSMLYVILINLLMGQTAAGLIAGLSVAGWISTARIVRGEMIRMKELEYIAAARMHGVPGYILLIRYFLPGTAGPLVINLTGLISQAIFTEAFLSFAGIGIAAPQASLGSLIQDSRSMVQAYPWQMIYPVLVLCLMIIAVNLVVADWESEGCQWS